MKENLINNQGFKECLVLIALCATRSISVRAPVVHTIAESRSSMSLNQNDLSALSRHESEIHPVDKLKWLFRRIYNSSVACESKVRHLVKFRQQFGRNLMRDGNPFSYLLPYRLDTQQADEFGTDTASSSGYSGTDSAASSSGATASRRYNRSRAGKSTGRHKSKSNGSQANTVRNGDNYLAKRRVSLAPQSNHLNWITLQDDSGQLYYFNRETNQTQREKPVMGISQPAAPLSPMTLAQRGDPRALARMSALDDMAAAAATSDMNAARTNSEAQMRLEEEAAEVAARWATSLKMRQEGRSGQRTVAEDTGPFLDPYGVGPGPTVGAAPGEESEEEIMRRAMLELDTENRNKSPPWRMDSGVSFSRNGRRGGHHGRTTTMSGFVVGRGTHR